jgi:hypothetical protein
LVSGQDFSAGDVTDAGTVAITILVLADGLVVGGLTYELDPTLTAAARETRNADERKAEQKYEKRRCCEPCIDDRCKDECRCCEKHEPEPCEKPKRPEHNDGRPCDCERERVCCWESKGWPRRIRVEIELEPRQQ